MYEKIVSYTRLVPAMGSLKKAEKGSGMSLCLITHGYMFHPFTTLIHVMAKPVA